MSLFEHEIVLRDKLETAYGLKYENDRYNREKATAAEKGAADDGRGMQEFIPVNPESG